jgi:phage terminase large subunit
MLDAFRGPLFCDAREKVLYGGSGSGKTHAVQQYLILKALQEPGASSLVVMETIPGVLLDMFYVMRDMLLDLGFKCKTRETTPIYIRLPNRHTIWFTSADKPEKLKYITNPKRVAINEATALSREKFQQLLNRMGRTSEDAELIFTFNPISEHHWLVEDYVQPYLDGAVREGVIVHHSTYRDNPFLAERWKSWLESMIEKDPNFYRVYALGLPGSLRGLVYVEGRDWTHAPLQELAPIVDAAPPRSLGLDFGFNHPSALVAWWPFERKRYVHELLHASELKQDELREKIIAIFRTYRWPFRTPIYCDSAEPDRIKDLVDHGLNALPAKKDIMLGIDQVRAEPLIVSEESLELIKELRNYKWAEDRDGQPKDEPVDLYNHGLDALRYAIATVITEPPRMKAIVRPVAPPRSFGYGRR